MQFGIVVPTYGIWGNASAIRDGIQAAEDLGYDTVWFGDHIVVPDYAPAAMTPRNWFEPISCAFVGAGFTRRIRFGIDVLVLPYRHPVELSQLFASADQLCGGRLTLGVGVGYIRGEYAAVTDTRYEDRGRVTDEYLEVLNLLWRAEGPATFHGRWVHFEDVWAEPKPAQSPFPLWVGGNAPAALRRAARLGNGWHPLFATPDVYAAARQAILDLRSEAGITEPFTFSYSASMTRVVLPGDPALAPHPRPTDIPAEYGYAPPPPVRSDGSPMFVGAPEQLAADLRALADAGVDHIALRFASAHPPHDVADFVTQAQRFMEKVAPHV